MKGLATRSFASLALVVSLGVATPLAAFAATPTTTTTTTPPSTPQVITTMKQWRAADKVYLAKLKVINLTFLAAVDTAKMNFATAASAATNATERISARATMRLAIAEATSARAVALTALGKPPAKPVHKTVL